MLSTQTNTRKQGDVGLGAAISYFTSRGITVSIPLTDSQDYDLIIDSPEDGLQKIQIKTTYHKTKSGAFEAGLRVNGGNRSGIGKVKLFDSDKVDLVFILTEDKDSYLIPSKLLGVNSVTLGSKWDPYKLGI